MRILLTASEMAPLARTGGLGDVLEALPAELAARGHEVSVVLPLYRGLRNDPALGVTSTGVEIPVQVGSKRVTAEIFVCTAPNGVQVFLIGRDEYFDRAGLYGEGGANYDDNAERFIFFSKAVLELARRITPPPEIIHANDWQSALIPILIKDRRLPFRSVLTIHNLAYQGSFWGLDFGLTNLSGDYFTARGLEFYGNMNLLKGGILFADQITTVSGRYAREIQTPELGAGLDAVIREHANKLTGILNGADYLLWNPENDSRIPENYTSDSLAGKKICRDALLKKMGLAPNPGGPVFALVTRLAQQKGIDLLIPLLDRLFSHDVRLVVLGEGDNAFERELTIASRRHAERFRFIPEMDGPLANLIFAGSDVFLQPSHFEPCGLTAMYALKYGSLPIAHATGGLYEMIQDYDPVYDTGNGVLFHDDNAEAFWDAIGRVLGYFADREHWQKLIRRAMACDFSWARSVEKYEAVYRKALGK
jgi:starch synthase